MRTHRSGGGLSSTGSPSRSSARAAERSRPRTATRKTRTGFSAPTDSAKRSAGPPSARLEERRARRRIRAARRLLRAAGDPVLERHGTRHVQERCSSTGFLPLRTVGKHHGPPMPFVILLILAFAAAVAVFGGLAAIPDRRRRATAGECRGSATARRTRRFVTPGSRGCCAAGSTPARRRAWRSRSRSRSPSSAVSCSAASPT